MLYRLRKYNLTAWELQRFSGGRWVGVKWPVNLPSAAGLLLQLILQQQTTLPAETVDDTTAAIANLTEAIETAVSRLSEHLSNEDNIPLEIVITEAEAQPSAK